MEKDGVTVDQGFLVARKEQCMSYRKFYHISRIIYTFGRQASLSIARLYWLVHRGAASDVLTYSPQRTGTPPILLLSNMLEYR